MDSINEEIIEHRIVKKDDDELGMAGSSTIP